MVLGKLQFKKYALSLIAIFILGVAIRFINFHESIYFGYDEARDAYISQDIYLNGNLTLLGPQATSYAGVHHGPLYYYILGPFFILGNGYPYLASVVFRLLNALGILGVFAVGGLLFGPLTGLASAFIFALSYEQYIYAIFTGNPSLSNLSWILMYLGVGVVWRIQKKREIGLTLMFLGASLAPQFDLITGYSLLLLPILLFLSRDKIKGIRFRKWLVIVLAGLSPLYSYLASELKNNFLATKILFGLVNSDTSIVGREDHVLWIFFRNFLGLFRDNVFDFSLNNFWISLFMAVIVIYLLVKPRRAKANFLVLSWFLSFSVLIFARGFMPYYSYAGVGVGLIIATSVVLLYVFRKSRLIGFALASLIIISNVARIYGQSSKSLIVEIKAQPGMKFTDEIKVIDKTYEYSDGAPFTIRATSMPYKVQTVWAYLYKLHGEKTYGYLPYYETGNVEGFPGELPVPQSGTTCNRFLITEPIRGIPENLILGDMLEEDYFSEVKKEEYVGQFRLQHRIAFSEDCS